MSHKQKTDSKWKKNSWAYTHFCSSRKRRTLLSLLVKIVHFIMKIPTTGTICMASVFCIRMKPRRKKEEEQRSLHNSSREGRQQASSPHPLWGKNILSSICVTRLICSLKDAHGSRHHLPLKWITGKIPPLVVITPSSTSDERPAEKQLWDWGRNSMGYLLT